MLSRMTHLSTLCLLGCCAALVASEVQPGLSNHGSDSDFVFPREDGVALTSTMEHVRLAWSNPTHTGFVKGGDGTVIELLERGFDPAYGESASPLLSDGVLVVSWSQPSGEISARLDSFKQRYFNDEERNKKMQANYLRIDADWHTMALDAETGETLWHNIEPSASLNFLSSKRGHDGISGAVRDGLYVTITMLGHVYAYDLKSGKQRWSTTLESWHQRAQEFKDQALAERNMPQVGEGPFGSKRAGAIIVDDLAIVPDLAGGLVGLKTSDGSQVWHTPAVIDDTASPRPWVDNGKMWLVCNQSDGRGDKRIHLLDPQSGSIQWSHKTGTNPGSLLMGEGYLMLNNKGSTKKDSLLTAYRLGTEGLTELWSFEDVKANGVQLRPDFGAHRKGLIHQGVLYLKAGSKRARMVAVDISNGKELHAVDDPGLGLNIGQPFIAEDKLYIHTNSGHSGKGAGLYVYQLEDAGQFSYLGEIPFNGLGIKQVTDYMHPIETPYAGGKLYMRGRTQIAAIDLTVVDTPMAELSMERAWAGFHRPVRALVFSEEDLQVDSARLESPPRHELGIVGTSAYRGDSWTPLNFGDELVLGKAVETSAELSFVPFSWTANIVMNEAEGEQWNGTWSRHFPGWDETMTVDGTLHDSSEGGYNQRGWPTGWLKDRPVTFFSDLPEGQERVFLQMHGFIPKSDTARRNMTLCLDHDGKQVVGGVGGGFQFNQGYHEIESSDLQVSKDGIKGTAIVIINPDPWVPGNYQKGDSLAGRLTLDIQFGKANDKGIYKVSGDWSVEWGIKHTRSGPIRGTITNK